MRTNRRRSCAICAFPISGDQSRDLSAVWCLGCTKLCSFQVGAASPAASPLTHVPFRQQAEVVLLLLSTIIWERNIMLEYATNPRARLSNTSHSRKYLCRRPPASYLRTQEVLPMQQRLVKYLTEDRIFGAQILCSVYFFMSAVSVLRRVYFLVRVV